MLEEAELFLVVGARSRGIEVILAGREQSGGRRGKIELDAMPFRDGTKPVNAELQRIMEVPIDTSTSESASCVSLELSQSGGERIARLRFVCEPMGMAAEPGEPGTAYGLGWSRIRILERDAPA